MDERAAARPDEAPLVSTLPLEESTPVAVVRAVASVLDVTPTELTPLYDAVDPQALERLVRTLTVGTISFEYEGLCVVVDDEGHVEVYSSTSS